MTKAAERRFLIADINAEWRRGRERSLSGAWDSDARLEVIDGDGVAGEILFPDGITEMNSPPFGGGFSMPAEASCPSCSGRAAARPAAGCPGSWRARAPLRSRLCADLLGGHGRGDPLGEGARPRRIDLPGAGGSRPPYHLGADPIWASARPQASRSTSTPVPRPLRTPPPQPVSPSRRRDGDSCLRGVGGTAAARPDLGCSALPA